MPRYLQDAVNTTLGHADPLTGYQLDTNRNLPSPVANYKPNNGPGSFFGTSHPNAVIMFKRDGRGSAGVEVVLHTLLTDLGPVTWTWGDGGATTVGDAFSRHVYAAAGTYTISISATSISAGAITASVSVTVETALPANTVVPTITDQTAGYYVASASSTAGSGYTQATTSIAFTAAPAGGVTATGTVTVTAGAVTGITITNPGNGYAVAPTGTITDSGVTPGTGAVVTVVTGTIPQFKDGNSILAANGTWSAADSYLVQWYSGGNQIAGQSGATYKLQPSDVGNTIHAAVAAVNSVGQSAFVSSVPSTAVVA